MLSPATLPDALDLAFAALAAGAADRHDAFHTPALASIGYDGAPALRTVILRRFDAAQRELQLHTDSRSPKAVSYTHLTLPT